MKIVTLLVIIGQTFVLVKLLKPNITIYNFIIVFIKKISYFRVSNLGFFKDFNLFWESALGF